MNTNTPVNVLTRGQQFGLLTVLDPEVPVYSEPRTSGHGSKPRKERGALVQCACGDTYVSLIKNLVRPAGGSKACRKCAREALRTQADILYVTHQNMMKRCYNFNDPSFANYGGRGIEVWAPWHNRTVFAEDIIQYLGFRPEGHSLDRIDNNGNYEPRNVRWASMKTQTNNTRRSHVKRLRKAYILDHWDTTADKLSKSLGISTNLVYNYREELRIENPDLPLSPRPKSGPAKKFTADQYRAAREANPEANWTELAAIMGCSPVTLRRIRSGA